MNFDGTFELDGITAEAVWLAESDPYMVKTALPGWEFLVAVDDANFDRLREATAAEEDSPALPDATPEHVADRAFVEGETYAARIELGVGSVKPGFETEMTSRGGRSRG